MEGIELLCFQMISLNGSARSCYVEAVTAAKKGDYEAAEQLLKEGDDLFIEGHKVHAKLIQEEAQLNAIPISLLLIHAEDQMMSAELFKIIAIEIIDLHKKID